jgi:hypothetical protein
MLGGDEIDEAPVKIDHALVAGRLVRSLPARRSSSSRKVGKESVFRTQTTTSNLLMSMVLVPKRMAPVQMIAC